MLYRIALAWALVFAIAVSTHAASIMLELKLNPAAPGCVGCTLSGPGTWNLVASDYSAIGGSFGISAYSIPVLNVSSVLHRAPRTNVDVDGEFFPAGFTSFRSANNAVGIANGFLIGATQDTFTPTPFLIRGYGQRASSFAAELHEAIIQNPAIVLPPTGTQTSWSSTLLLAEGTYSPGSLPLIDFNSVDLGVNVFADANGIRSIAANFFPTVPEPATATLFALAIAGVLAAKRQRLRLTPQWAETRTHLKPEQRRQQ